MNSRVLFSASAGRDVTRLSMADTFADLSSDDEAVLAGIDEVALEPWKQLALTTRSPGVGGAAGPSHASTDLFGDDAVGQMSLPSPRMDNGQVPPADWKYMGKVNGHAAVLMIDGANAAAVGMS